LGAAAAIGRQDEVGSLEVGKRCDLLVLDADTHSELPYHWGVNLVRGVVVDGRVVVSDGSVVDSQVGGAT
jgi:imidazolonepropionase